MYLRWRGQCLQSDGHPAVQRYLLCCKWPLARRHAQICPFNVRSISVSASTESYRVWTKRECTTRMGRAGRMTGVYARCHRQCMAVAPQLARYDQRPPLRPGSLPIWRHGDSHVIAFRPASVSGVTTKKATRRGRQLPGSRDTAGGQEKCA